MNRDPNGYPLRDDDQELFETKPRRPARETGDYVPGSGMHPGYILLRCSWCWKTYKQGEQHCCSEGLRKQEGEGHPTGDTVARWLGWWIFGAVVLVAAAIVGTLYAFKVIG